MGSVLVSRSTWQQFNAFTKNNLIIFLFSALSLRYALSFKSNYYWCLNVRQTGWCISIINQSIAISITSELSLGINLNTGVICSHLWTDNFCIWFGSMRRLMWVVHQLRLTSVSQGNVNYKTLTTNRQAYLFKIHDLQ